MLLDWLGYVRDGIVLAVVSIAGCCCLGCEKPWESVPPSSSVSRIVYLWCNLDTGSFEGYASNNEGVIRRLRSALVEDMKGDELPRGIEYTLSVNHVLLLYAPDGAVLSTYKVLGDEDLRAHGRKYDARATMRMLDELVSGNRLEKVPITELRGLAGASPYVE